MGEILEDIKLIGYVLIGFGFATLAGLMFAFGIYVLTESFSLAFIMGMSVLFSGLDYLFKGANHGRLD